MTTASRGNRTIVHPACVIMARQGVLCKTVLDLCARIRSKFQENAVQFASPNNNAMKNLKTNFTKKVSRNVHIFLHVKLKPNVPKIKLILLRNWHVIIINTLKVNVSN